MGVCVLGSINLDSVCSVARLPAPGETLMAERFERFAGGKGANQAVASAAWGATTMIIGAVGRDEAGDRLIAHLEGRGVDVSAVAHLADAPSGQAHISVAPTGENMIVVIGGANRAVTAEHVGAADMAGCTVFLSQLETPLDAVAALFAAPAARAGVKVLNAAPALTEARALFPLVDILVLNQGELGLYAAAAEPVDARNAAPLARRLICRPAQTIVVTLGAAGALAVTQDHDAFKEGLSARVVDTTGAGDCFCGVLAAALAEGCSIESAMASANAAAAISTESRGAAAPSTLRSDLGRRL